MRTDGEPSDRLLHNVAIAAATLVVLTVVVSQFVPDPPLPPGVPAGARSLPRMRPPPQDAGELLRSLGVGSVAWYASLVSAPIFVLVGRLAPPERGRRALSFTAQLLTVIAFALVTAWVQFRVMYGGSELAPPLSAYLQIGLIGGTLPFLTVAAVIFALDASSRAHQRELEASRVRSQLAESRLEALTAQLQPHFLFNTLQGISTLIRRDPEQADAMLDSLSELLREVLRRGERREVPLADELRVIEPYLDIARRRFGDRLSIDVEIESGCERVLVPFFLLQPLVENAIQHGIAAHAGAGRVEIRARMETGSMVVSVLNDACESVPDGERQGIGLANTRARLAEMYRDRASLQTVKHPSGGFEARVMLPARTE